MLNYLWAGMILLGVVYGMITGTFHELTDGILNSAKEAVSLCIMMCGIISMWSGVMEIAASAGLIEDAAKKIDPVFHFLFPDIPKGHPSQKYMTANMIANILGLGWAATPAGLKAMEHLDRLNHSSQAASRDMCTFLILNISSLQLIPINIIAYRSQYGSVDPALILGPAVIATAVSTAAGILFSKIMK